MSNVPASQDPKRKYLLWGIPICAIMMISQLDRAIGGNSRSWLYVFEWPFFALFLYYMYWKLGKPDDYDDSNDPKRELQD